MLERLLWPIVCFSRLSSRAMLLLKNILKLGMGVKAEQEALTESTKLAPKAAEGLKSLNPMKMGKAKKALDFGNKCNQIVTEETAYQAEIVAKLGK